METVDVLSFGFKGKRNLMCIGNSFALQKNSNKQNEKKETLLLPLFSLLRYRMC